jgi:hypothetical protein
MNPAAPLSPAPPERAPVVYLVDDEGALRDALGISWRMVEVHRARVREDERALGHRAREPAARRGAALSLGARL